MLPTITLFWHRSGRAGHIVATMACLALSFVSLGWQQDQSLPIPLAQYCYVLPAVGLGLAIGLNWLTYTERWSVVFAGIATLSLAAALGYREGLVQLSMAYTALLLCLALPLPDTSFSRLCAKFSMTVYLVHPLALSLIDRGLHLSPHSLMRGLMAIVVSLIAAALLDYLQHCLAKRRRQPFVT